MPTYDFIVIGSGIAGLSYTVKVADYFQHRQIPIKIALITKTVAEETNTKYAQGGIATVWDSADSFEKHIEDTMVAGDFVSDRKVVEIVVNEAPARLKELIAYGTDFDRQADGSFDLVKEGGHSDKRILHHKDSTGNEIERALLAKVKSYTSVDFFTHYFAVDLITQHHLGEKVTKDTPGKKCFGVYVLNLKTNKIETFLGKTTLLATGGIGQVYQSTTNPTIATGDGISMAYRAKAFVQGMEFIQFHPTALYNPGKKPSFLISEAVRGHGGILKNQDGSTFMEKYDARLSLAPRDIVARAIFAETQAGRGPMLDTRAALGAEVLTRFPSVADACARAGIDPVADAIPVAAAAHYHMGGIETAADGRASLAELWVCGEASSTGLHGANRLASNSLLECFVFGEAAASDILAAWDEMDDPPAIREWDESRVTDSDEEVVIKQNWTEIRRFMWNYVGIVRTTKRLERAASRIELLKREVEDYYGAFRVTTDLIELRNLLQSAELIVQSALRRKESRGLHYTLDYPELADEPRDTVLVP